MRKRKRGRGVWKCRKAKCQEVENWQVICKQLCSPCCTASTLQFCLEVFCTCCEVQKQVFLGLYSTCCETSCNELGQTGVKAPQGCHAPNTHLHFRRKNHFYIPNYIRSGLLFSLFFRLTVGFLWSYPTSPIEIRGFVLQLFYLLPFLQFHQFRHRHHHRPPHHRLRHLNYHHRHHQHDHVDDYQSHERFALQISDKNFLVVSRQVSQPGWADLIGYAKPVIFASKSKTDFFTPPLFY